MTSPTDPWWRFDLTPSSRADADTNRLLDDNGIPIVNAPDEDGRLRLDYAEYLHLDALLGAQQPSSSVPDERVFVIVHQLSELVFKQMAFDLTVVSATFERLLGIGGRQGPEALHALALAEGEVDDADSEAAAFWRPAITASNRLRHSARSILPSVMQLMGRSGDNDVLFSTIEFGAFRSHLEPSSGFQTAQLRLLQRALGKGPLLDVRVFPGDKFGSHYTGHPCAHVALADPLILRGDRPRAVPDTSHPSARAAGLDLVAHALLAQLPQLGPEAPPPPSVRTIHPSEVQRAVDRFRTTLGLAAGATPSDAEEATERFRDDLVAATDAENTRRAEMGDARAGAYALQVRAPRSALTHVLSRIVALDDALHATQPDSFLSVHRSTVRRHVHDEGGTGGGGMPYLVTSQRYLFPLFPALVAYQDLEDPVG